MPHTVTVVDTGRSTMAGGRVRRIRPFVGDEAFMLTYGGGVADVDVPALLAFHRSHGRTATLTGVSVAQRFGVLDVLPGGGVASFREKHGSDGGMINGGFMVMEPGMFSLIKGDDEVLEEGALETLARQGELMA
ncbi:MAG: glucose-1-phosphate cytidylyltransferase, partial [Coriobacteriales bacterium]|nr:glucose-1-phosphate cytidylyltransferase [Coriobacteriales bacterium]